MDSGSAQARDQFRFVYRSVYWLGRSMTFTTGLDLAKFTHQTIGWLLKRPWPKER